MTSKLVPDLPTEKAVAARIGLPHVPFERRGNSPCLISLVKAIRVRVQSLSNSLVVRGPDHFFNNKYRRRFPECPPGESIPRRRPIFETADKLVHRLIVALQESV
jgi:hypothetical protein